MLFLAELLSFGMKSAGIDVLKSSIPAKTLAFTKMQVPTWSVTIARGYHLRTC